MSDQPTFREELERLEAIVRALEDTDLDLDQAIELFEEGVTRLKTARKMLESTELTVKKVIRGARGSIRTDDLEH